MEQARVPQRYTLIEEVGQGGMAVVYRAQDETLKREVAIKILHQHLAGEPESKARLEREAQAVAKLHHDNILEIFDYSGLASQSSYIVTEFIDGQTLKQYLTGRPLGFSEVAALIAVEICQALGHAHSLGVIHRDVKPENVMIRKDGLIKLMDFGIAQVLDFQRMTVTGQLLGSPAYMAPEIIEGKQLDFRTDVFSVGIVLYLLATGELPFAGRNPHEVLRRIAEGKFPDPRSTGRGVDQVLSRIITRALARQPDDRYPDVGPLCDDLTAYLTEAGLTDVRAELRAYFGDPAAYDQALPKRLAAALTESAQAQLGGRPPRQGDGAVEPGPRLRPEQRDGDRGAAASAGAPAAAPGHDGAPRWSPPPRAVSGRRRITGDPTRRPPPSPRRCLPLRASPISRAAPAPVPAAPVTPPAAPQRRVSAVVHPAHSRGEGHAARRRRPGRGHRERSRWGRRPRTSTSTSTASGSSPTTRTTRRSPSPGTSTTCWSCAAPAAAVSSSGWRSGPITRCRPMRSSPAASSGARPTCVVTTEPAVATARVLVSDPNRKVAATAGRPGEEIDVPFFADDDSSKEIEVAVDGGEAFASEKIRVRAGERLTHVVKLKTGAPAE